MLEILLVLAFIIDVFINIQAEIHDNRKLKIFSKPLLMPLLIFIYLLNCSEVNILLVGALFCGFIGDVALIPAIDIRNKINPYSIMGFLAFFTGHLLYSAVFLYSSSPLKNVPLWFFSLSILYLLGGLGIFRLIFSKISLINKKEVVLLKLAALLYMGAILFMSFSSLTRIWNGINLAFILPFIGSLLFILSDTLLALESISDRSGNYRPVIMFSYILAQLMIVMGFCGS